LWRHTLHRFALTDNANVGEVGHVFANPTPADLFVDGWGPDTEDGDWAKALWALAWRSTGKQKTAVSEAKALVTGLSFDTSLSPYAALSKGLTEVLHRLREARGKEESSAREPLRDPSMSDERHLLAGRNFLSFRHDMAAVIERRLALATHLSLEAKIAVLVALLMADGHRFSVFDEAAFAAACDRYVQAA